MSQPSPAPHRRTQARRVIQPEARPSKEFPPPQPWEDTQTQPVITSDRPASRRFRPLRLALALCVAVALLLGGIWGYRQWQAWEARRAQERAERQLAEERARYKLVYRDLIDAYAQERGINPAFVAAIIYCESRFDPTAQSGIGAMGLMQIRDTTGQWIAEMLGEDDGFTTSDLYDPETSIRYGTWYLHFLMDLFGNDLVKIAAAYHAGQGTVAAWLEDPAVSANGQTLDRIPYADTKQYVERVSTAYEMYVKHYYGEDAPTSGE